MRMKGLIVFVSMMTMALAAKAAEASDEAADMAATAHELARRLMIVDTHIDTPGRVVANWVDVTQRTPNGDSRTIFIETMPS